MANDADPVPTSDVINTYGLESALDPSPIPAKTNGNGFLAQISGNPFFTAVSMLQLQGWRFQNADNSARDLVSLDLVPSLQSARKVFAMAQVLLKNVYSSMLRSISKMNHILGFYTG